MNDRSHSEHLNGRSPVWSMLCLLSDALEERRRWQMVHWNRVEVVMFLRFLNGRGIPAGLQRFSEMSGDCGRPRLSRRTILDRDFGRGVVPGGDPNFLFLSLTPNSTPPGDVRFRPLLKDPLSVFPLVIELPGIGCCCCCCRGSGRPEGCLVRLMTGLLNRLPEQCLRGTFTTRELLLTSSPPLLLHSD